MRRWSWACGWPKGSSPPPLLSGSASIASSTKQPSIAWPATACSNATVRVLERRPRGRLLLDSILAEIAA